MAHNLARWAARIGLEEQLVTTKTLRRRFFSIAGRLTHTARRLTLHLPQRWPWETQFTHALARLRAIPRNSSDLRGSADYSAYCGGATEHGISTANRFRPLKREQSPFPCQLDGAPSAPDPSTGQPQGLSRKLMPAQPASATSGMSPGRFRRPPPLRAATLPLAWPPPTTLNPIDRDRARPVRLPVPIIPRVNATAVSLRWIRAKVWPADGSKVPRRHPYHLLPLPAAYGVISRSQSKGDEHCLKSNVTELRSHKVSWRIQPRNERTGHRRRKDSLQRIGEPGSGFRHAGHPSY